MSALHKALVCVHARTSDTLSIARKTGVPEATVYSMWIAHRDAEHRKRERDRLQSSQRGQMR
jgi:hypothetical protein